MSVQAVLDLTSASILLIEERESKDIVIGVPHHAPAGTQSLPCPDHRDADENTGHLGRYIAEKLSCSSIVAGNYRFDVNKNSRSDYFSHILQWNPRFLVEIHGHGEEKARSDIEISSGSIQKNAWSIQLERRLRHRCEKMDGLRDLSICGQFEKIYFKASNSATIVDSRWISFHIELPIFLRKPSDPSTRTPPPLGYRFCDCLVAALREVCRGHGA